MPPLRHSVVTLECFIIAPSLRRTSSSLTGLPTGPRPIILAERRIAEDTHTRMLPSRGSSQGFGPGPGVASSWQARLP